MSNRVINPDEILIPQKHLGMGLYVGVIITMMTVQWMALDMYLPALPVLKTEFGTTEALLNVSLNSELVMCAVGTFVGGTLSDKYGRNRIMIIGLIVAAIPLLAAAFAKGVILLIVTRGISGLGGGFALTVAAAIIRDSFKGKTFRTITTITQAAAVVGPIFAPAIGAFLIEFLSWRWIFILLGGATVITLIPFLFATETWPKVRRRVTSVWQATVQSFDLVRNREYITFLVYMMIITIPMWAYLAVCAYIYYEEFGVSNIQYSILYAAASGAAFVAPFIYIWLSRKISGKHTLEIIMGMMALSVMLLALVGHRGPVLFLIAIVPIVMIEAMARSMCLVVVLEEYPEEAGTASSVTGFALLIVGIIGTSIATLQWSSLLFGLTVITAESLVAMLALWIVIVKKKVYSKHLGL